MGQPRNILVAYELHKPERGDDRIRDAIEAFRCPWAKVHANVFFMHGDLDASFVGGKVWAAMNMDDKLVVIDATKNDARWYNIKPEVSEFLVANWHAEPQAPASSAPRSGPAPSEPKAGTPPAGATSAGAKPLGAKLPAPKRV